MRLGAVTSAGAIEIGDNARIYQGVTLGAFSPYYLLQGNYEIFYYDLSKGTRMGLIPPFSVIDVFLKISAIDLFIAGLSASVAAHSARLVAPRIAWRTLLAALILGLFIAISSMLLYSISTAYQALAAKGMVFYVGSRYAYIGWIIVIAAFFIALAKAIPLGRAPLLIAFVPYLAVAGFVFIGSATSSFLNERVAQTMRINASKWQAVGAALECRPLAQAMKGKPVLAPILWNQVWYAHIRPDDYWRRYATRHFAQPIAFRRTVSPDSGNNPAYFDYRMDQHGRVFAVTLATDYRDGIASNLLVLTPRDALVRLTFQGASGVHEKHLSWGPGIIACGEYVLSSVTNENMRLNTLYFEKSEFLSLPGN